MTARERGVLGVLLVISVIYFGVFVFPNNTGAKDQMMISLFQPDEFAQYPVVTKMLRPLETLPKTILNFVAYRHYYYGSPFYFSSALLVAPVQLAEGLGDTQLNMLLLREFISVLPMLAALLLLTYVQTKFQSLTEAMVLFVLLLSVSAVVKNNLWWHADSLAFFFVALTLFFLDQDDLRFGRHFGLAGVAAGLAAGTKVIGLFFVLAIPTYVLAGVVGKRLTWRAAFLRGATFTGIMAATILISNPFLVFPSQLVRMLRIMSQQSTAMSSGWILTYAKGPGSWLPIIEDWYGLPVFLLLAFLALVIGIWRGPNKRLHLLIAAWAVPFGLYVLFAVAIKPTHLFLPILLPIFSSVLVPLAGPLFESDRPRRPMRWLIGGIVLVIIGYQFVTFVRKDASLYGEVLDREQRSETLVFYETIEKDYLPRVRSADPLVVFRDVRVYFPDTRRWIVRSFWNIDYRSVETVKPDLIVLWSQRIADYTQPGALENAVNPAEFQNTYQFYMDVKNGQLRGYHLLYRGGGALLFASNPLYDTYFR